MILPIHKSKIRSWRMHHGFCRLCWRLLPLLWALITLLVACNQVSTEQRVTPLIQASVSDFVYDAFVEKTKAKADFYQGVRLLNSGNVAEALVALQRAIALEPENALVRYWLARAHAGYGQSGFANTIYRELIDANFYPTYLTAALEVSQHMARKEPTTLLQKDISSAIRAVSLDLSQRNYRIPMTVRPLSNGFLLVSALGSNTLSLLNPVTMMSKDFVKTTSLLNRPMDALVLSNGTIVVSEFASNAMSAFSYNGDFLGSFIQNAVPQNFSGPQFLAVDADGNVYVSTAGTAHVAKFDSKGVFLLEFGAESQVQNAGAFLENPTGVAIIKNNVWVLDHKAQNLYLVQYDPNGNFIARYFIAKTRAESLRAYGHLLLLAGETSVMVFNTETLEVIDELKSTDFIKITSAAFDNNEMLWVVDQFRNRLEAFSAATNQYAGLRTRLLSLRTESFPNVTARVSVNSATGVPVIGLGRENFVAFENDVSVQTMRVRSDDETVQETQVVMVPFSSGSSMHKAQIVEGVEQLVNGGLFVQSAEDIGNDIVNVWVIRASSSLGYELERGNVAVQITEAVRNAAQSAGSSAFKEQRAQLQLQAFGMALNTLLPTAGKKSVLFIGDAPELEVLQGEEWQRMMERARDNVISVLWVYMRPATQTEQGTKSATIFEAMLQTHDVVTAGERQVFYYPNVMQNVNVTLAQRLRQASRGVYTIAFQSRYAAQGRQYGEKYVALSLESYYFTRSGKDIGGYIIPAE